MTINKFAKEILDKANITENKEWEAYLIEDMKLAFWERSLAKIMEKLDNMDKIDQLAKLRDTNASDKEIYLFLGKHISKFDDFLGGLMEEFENKYLENFIKE